MSFRQEILEKRQAFRVYIPLVILYFLSYFQRTSLPGTIFDTLSADLHLNASGMAALAASFVYPYAVCQIFSGALVDRFCGTRVVMAGGAVMLAGILLFPLSASLPMLCAARALTGIGSSTIFLALVRETDRLFGRKNYALIFGIAYFCGYAGGLSGTLPFERLCAAYPWRHVLFGAAAVTAAGYLALLGAGLRSKMPPVPDTPFSLKPYRNVIANPLSWRMILCANVNFCIFFVIQTVFGKKFLQDFAGLSSAVSAGVIFAMTLVCMGIMLTTSILSRLTGNRRRPLILGACGVTLLGTLLMVSAIRLRLPGWSFAAAYILFSAGAGIPQIFSMTMQEFNSRDIIAQAAATLNMFGYLFVAVFSQITGMVLDLFGGRRLPDGTLNYPDQAYLAIFVFLALAAAASFFTALHVPETRGHCLHLHSQC